MAEGIFAPGHLGELTRIIPFEMVDTVLAECGAVQQRLRKLPARVSSTAVLTSDGIILIDALNSPDEARTVIEPGLRALGADPATVKYVVLTHGHTDHIGGAQHFADNHGTRVLATPADWDYMESTDQRGRPDRDLDITDGQHPRSATPP